MDLPPGFPLLGRDVELSSLIGALEQAEKGQAQLAFIEGEGGIGKTRLIEEAAKEADRRGFEIWIAAADELEQDRPFGPLAEALGLRRGVSDPVRAEIGALLSASPTDSNMVAPSFRARLIEDIVSVIEQAASERPVVLILEDLQWADPSTLLTLRRLVRRAALARLAVIASARPSSVTNHLADTPGVHHLWLSPLDETATTILLTHLVDATPGPKLLSEAAKAGGNPLFVTELVAALQADEMISTSAGVAEFNGGSLPHSLRLLILRRLSFLSEEALDTLKVAAMLGTSFTVADLSAVKEKRASEMTQILQEAINDGLLRPSGEHLVWRHDLVRDAIYQDLPLSMRRALHVQSARALAGAGADALKVAAHFSLGASPGDTEAVVWLRRAARDAAPRDAAIQAELLERALILISNGHSERDELEVELAGAFLWSGRVADAEELARAVLEKAKALKERDEARSVLSLSLFFQNRMGEAGAEFEAAADDPLTPETRRSNLLAQAAMGYLQGGNPAKAVGLAENVVSLGKETENHFATAIGHSVLAWVSYFSSHVARSIDLQRHAAAEADLDITGEAHRRHPFLAPGLMLLEGDLMEEATQSFRSGLELGQRLGIVWHTPLYHYGLGMPSFYAGKWDDMRAEFETAWGLTEETGSSWGSVAFRNFAAWASVHRDDLEGAEELLKVAQVALENQGPTMESVWTPWATGVFLDASGRPEEGLAVFSDGWDMFASLGLMVAFRLLGPDLTRMCVAAGDITRAQAVASKVEEHARHAEVSSAQGAALQCRGLADDAPDLLIAAVAAYRQSPRVVHFALASEDAGECLVRHDRADEARKHLQEALDIYDRVSMRRDARRVEGRLRSLGIRRGARGRRGRPQHGWDSLTATEVRVASLASDGMTNPQIAERLFISRRTVETHMSHVLTKVGLSSRVELAAEVARRAATT